MAEKAAQVNVFDYEVSGFDDEKKPSQEMQERGSANLLGKSTTNNEAHGDAIADSQWSRMDEEDTHAHIEHAN
jgi:hypothetical protein